MSKRSEETPDEKSFDLIDDQLDSEKMTKSLNNYFDNAIKSKLLNKIRQMQKMILLDSEAQHRFWFTSLIIEILDDRIENVKLSGRIRISRSCKSDGILYKSKETKIKDQFIYRKACLLEFKHKYEDIDQAVYQLKIYLKDFLCHHLENNEWNEKSECVYGIVASADSYKILKIYSKLQMDGDETGESKDDDGQNVSIGDEKYRIYVNATKEFYIRKADRTVDEDGLKFLTNFLLSIYIDTKNFDN